MIIPWPVVGTIVCVVAFFAVTVPLVGQSQVAFDSFLVGNSCAGLQGFDRSGSLGVALLDRLVNGVSTWSIVVTAVLTWAFAANRKTAAAHILLGPIPLAPVHRKNQLLAAELLIGVLAAVWLCCVCVNHFVQRHGPLMGIASLPDSSIVGAVAFWGIFASVSWHVDWRSGWRRFGTALFILALPLSIFGGLYTCRDWPSDVVSSLLLGASLLCMALYVLNAYFAQSFDTVR